jgi:hypothetical protein
MRQMSGERSKVQFMREKGSLQQSVQEKEGGQVHHCRKQQWK